MISYLFPCTLDRLSPYRADLLLISRYYAEARKAAQAGRLAEADELRDRAAAIYERIERGMQP